MATTCFQKPVTYLDLLFCSLTTWSSFFPPFCQRLQGALLTRVAGRVVVENWLVSFTSSGGPPSAFLSVFIRGPQDSRSQLQEIPKSKVPWWCYPLILRGSRLSQEYGTSLPLLSVSSCLLVAKPNLCLQTTIVVGALFFVLVFSFLLPSAILLSNHIALLWLFCSDLWGMDSMNLIGSLVYGIHDLKNFVSSSPWIHQNID